VIQAFRIYRHSKFAKANRMVSRKRSKRIQPLYDKLRSGQPVTTTDIYDYAKNIMTREMTFKILQRNGNAAIFPNEFNTFEKAAESNLANWLEFPTELNTCPDEIEYIKRVAIGHSSENIFYYYEVFKFRVDEPHRAAKKGWILGVVGPYFNDSKPYDHPGCTFSRLSLKSNNGSAEQEAQWVHENILSWL